ncbi:glycosyltransferase [Paenibacillus sp. P96]|uniref:Glycosyltransferase n=1 Tax=Paenibacillus zeirhizosphaerae TaxID=2987519 RepID=A0ABT9FV73_9BACL|nr:glycosyltransferase [Paenibacillus sp. P96]MDP4098595.1 glycosyltransferase [Paenibacillus sp. P96]
MRKTIALCMIVKNEQQFLRRCLDSVKGKVDQIIIVDTGSTDNTISIASEYTEDIFHMEWINDFAAARNESIKHAETDYILILDADEYLESSTDLEAELGSEADYYFVNICNLMSGERAMTHMAIRLFKNKIGLYYKNRLHEHLNTTEREDQLLAGYASFTIMHTGYTDEMMRDREKARRNLSLMKVEVEENPSVYNIFNMGRTYMWLGEHEKAIKYLQQAYPMSKNLTIAPELIASLCRSLGELGRYEEALTVLKEAVEVYPREVDLRHIQALFYWEIGYSKDAIECMKKCMEIGDKGITFMEGNGTYIARFRLAEWHTSRNEFAQGYEHIVEALKLKNDFVPIMAKYFEIVEKAQVPLNDVLENVDNLFDIQHREQLQKLLEVLYQLRHPLLLKYMDMYKVNVQSNVTAVAHQYDRDHQQARKIWLELTDLEEQNGTDILLLAMILRDEELFRKAVPLLNLNVKEKKLLLKVVSNEPVEVINMTTHVEHILERISVYLIRLQEFEIFEIVLNYLWSGSIGVKTQVCVNLVAYGFSEIAIDLLANLYKDHPRNMSVVKLLGDVCFKSGYFEDAKLFYTKLVGMCDEYSAYEHMYDLYDKMNDANGKDSVLAEISKKFSLCLWAK